VDNGSGPGRFSRDAGSQKVTRATVDQNSKPNARCTVIVLNFNGEHLLPDCLDSLARQTGIEIDTVVVDNASTDGSAALVAQ
jgi:hypothetical protein